MKILHHQCHRLPHARLTRRGVKLILEEIRNLKLATHVSCLHFYDLFIYRYISTVIARGYLSKIFLAYLSICSSRGCLLFFFHFLHIIIFTSFRFTCVCARKKLVKS